MRTWIALLVFGLTANGFSAHALDSATVESKTRTDLDYVGSTRAEKRVGIGTGILSLPYSIIGLSFGFNATEQIRLFGNLSSNLFYKTAGIGVKHILMPEEAFSPLLGAGYSEARDRDWLAPYGIRTDMKIRMAHVSAGMDWQLANGFNLGGGLHWVFASAPKEYDVRVVMPYFDIGWYF